MTLYLPTDPKFSSSLAPGPLNLSNQRSGVLFYFFGREKQERLIASKISEVFLPGDKSDDRKCICSLATLLSFVRQMRGWRGSEEALHPMNVPQGAPMDDGYTYFIP